MITVQKNAIHQNLGKPMLKHFNRLIVKLKYLRQYALRKSWCKQKNAVSDTSKFYFTAKKKRQYRSPTRLSSADARLLQYSYCRPQLFVSISPKKCPGASKENWYIYYKQFLLNWKRKQYRILTRLLVNPTGNNPQVFSQKMKFGKLNLEPNLFGKNTCKDKLQRWSIVWTMLKKCDITAVKLSWILGWALKTFATWRI